MKTKNISPVIANVLGSVEANYSTPAHRIWDVWAEAVGPDIAKRAAPLEFRAGRLTIGVEGSAWLQQLVFLAPHLIEALNARLPKPIVKSIKPVAAKPGDRPPEEKAEPLLREGPLSEVEQALLDESLSSIEDEDIRRAAGCALETALRRNRPPRTREG